MEALHRAGAGARGGLLFTPVECCLWIFNRNDAALRGGGLLFTRGFIVYISDLLVHVLLYKEGPGIAIA